MTRRYPQSLVVAGMAFRLVNDGDLGDDANLISATVRASRYLSDLLSSGDIGLEVFSGEMASLMTQVGWGPR